MKFSKQRCMSVRFFHRAFEAHVCLSDILEGEAVNRRFSKVRFLNVRF